MYHTIRLLVEMKKMTAKPTKIKQSVDDWLNSVSYEHLTNYQPTEFSIMFVNAIKLINGGSEENITPPCVLQND